MSARRSHGLGPAALVAALVAAGVGTWQLLSPRDADIVEPEAVLGSPTSAALVREGSEPRRVVADSAPASDEYPIVGDKQVYEVSVALWDDDPKVRRAALAALGRMGARSSGVLPLIERLKKDPDRLVRRFAEEASQKIRATQSSR